MKVLVIGCGIVGLSCAVHLVQDGHEVVMVDRDPAGDKASFGNAGGIAVTEVLPAAGPGVLRQVPRWLLDPLGPLAVRPLHAPRLLPWLWRFVAAGRPAAMQRIAGALAALNGRVYADLVPLLALTGLSDQLQRNGSITVYESEAALARDAAAWALSRRLGVEAEPLDRAAVHAMEPALGPMITCGMFTPQWSQVDDPKRLVDGLRSWVQTQGVVIETGTVAAIEDKQVRLQEGRSLDADTVVVAAGAWSGRLARAFGDRVLLESERGYNTTLPNPGIALRRQITFAERHFVAAPLGCGLRIGGAAEFGGLEALADHRRSRALATLAARYLPGLNRDGGVEWAGHRPSTPDSLPVIGASRRPGVFYAFGHGHLGLTQSAPTGRLIADLVGGRPPAIDLAPYAIQRFG